MIGMYAKDHRALLELAFLRQSWKGVHEAHHLPVLGERSEDDAAVLLGREQIQEWNSRDVVRAPNDLLKPFTLPELVDAIDPTKRDFRLDGARAAVTLWTAIPSNTRWRATEAPAHGLNLSDKSGLSRI